MHLCHYIQQHKIYLVPPPLQNNSALRFIIICFVQGYLSCNRFGTFLGLAHAAMTAEGDNSVLMQKVAKEVSM